MGKGEQKPEDPEAQDGSGNISWQQAMIASGLALSIPGMLFGPPAIGYWLDSVFGTKPWLFLIALGIGFVGTAFDVYLLLKRSGIAK